MLIRKSLCQSLILSGQVLFDILCVKDAMFNVTFTCMGIVDVKWNSHLAD